MTLFACKSLSQESVQTIHDSALFTAQLFENGEDYDPVVNEVFDDLTDIQQEDLGF